MKIALLTTDSRDHYRTYADPVPAFGTAPAALLAGFAEIPGIEVHVVACVQRPLRSPAKIAPNIFYHSLVVPKRGWMRTLYGGCILAVRKKLREIQPDVVHGQGTERDCAISAVFGGFPNVLTIHGNMRLVAQVNQARPFSFNWLAARLEGFVLPRTRGVVCITNYTRVAVKNLARQTWVVPNAVDAGFFEVENAPDPSRPPIGLCVGSVSLRKNQNDFIRALDALAKQRPLKIVFLGGVGNDAYGREFLELVRTRPWCEHAGFADREALKARLKSATFLALPTLEDNCPMVVLEAMAAGVPVIASKVGGVPDLIDPERTGLFCDPQQPESFGAGIVRLLDNAEFARQLADRARAEARQRFHPKVIARRHVEVYREVLGG